MRILYVAPKYDYGEISRGYSFEHYNFYDCLTRMGHQLIYYDFMTELEQHGKGAMNARIFDIVRLEHPDLLFCVLSEDQIYLDTIRTITNKTDTLTFNWFCDDNWRFDTFSRHWAPVFNWVSTTYQTALDKYISVGIKNVIKTQWGCNHHLYRLMSLSHSYGVTFVGQLYGRRRQIIERLRKAGIDARVWGHGWPSGRLSQEELIETFNRSAINLNFTQSSSTGLYWKNIINQVFKMERGITTQIKARTFEIPGCGAFMLTGMAENLSDYYVPGQEIAVFENTCDLIAKIQYYLSHEPERIAIAQAGYRRTLAEHTLERRLNDIFSCMGLPNTAEPAVDSGLGNASIHLRQEAGHRDTGYPSERRVH